MKKFFTWIILSLIGLNATAQKLNEVSTNWTTHFEPKEAQIGDTVKLVITFEMIDSWYVYGSERFSKECLEMGPSLTKFTPESIAGLKPLGKLTSSKAKKKYSDIFMCDYTKYAHKALFEQYYIIQKEGVHPSEGTINCQICSDEKHICLDFSKKLSASITGLKRIKKTSIISIPENQVEVSKNGDINKKATTDLEPENTICCDSLQKIIANTQVKELSLVASAELKKCDIPRRAGFDDIKVNLVKKTDSEKKQSFLLLMILAFAGGLLTLITPCVFPLIPMTVSYFTKSDKGSGVYKAIIYGLSIIAIYVSFGLITSILLGENAANIIAAHWLPNIIFFAIFMVFAFSFLGAFEITLPNSWVNSADKQADKGGFVGIFFMAFTLVLVSFSCTGPIASSFLIGAANGNFLGPILGMLAYSFGLALPFVLFSFFPSVLNKLPKSGGWLNSVKVVFGLLEFAFAFKFLSQVDLVQGWGLLDRDVYLSIWIATFGVMFLYLIGKIKFSHDSELKGIGVFRGVLAIVVLSFTIYLIPGMWGAPLKPLAGLLPPIHTQDFNLSESSSSRYAEVEICETPLYGEKVHLPHGLKGFFDVRQALCCAKSQGKPLFVDFTGHTCSNCREVEAKVWSDPKVLKLLNENYVILSLYGDDETKIIEPYTKNGNQITTLGEQSTDFVTTFLKANGKPTYSVMGINEIQSSKDNLIVLDELVPQQHYTSDVDEYVKFLESGITVFNDANK